MAELANIFSWSISARDDFNECRRRRYWSKYAMWNGWRADAAEVQRAAYRLSKMGNRWTLLGNAVEQAVMWALRQCQAGRAVGAQEAYEQAARPWLNRHWSESRRELWRSDPKRFCCLHEHYYPDLYRVPAESMTAELISRARQCLANFLEHVLPRLAAVRPEQELPVGAPGAGEPESFRLDDVKVYAIPDYVYRADNRLHIHDWKAGQPRPAHRDQMAVYGLWAVCKHRLPAEQVSEHLEYLLAGKTISADLQAADEEAARRLIGESVAEMAEYLEDGDLRRNQPRPREDWEMCAETEICRRCNFFELCQPEF